MDIEDNRLGIAQVSPDGVFLRANRALCAMLGYTEAELQTLRVRDLTHPEDRPQSANIVDRSFRHNEEAVEVIKRYLHKDGSVVWALLRTTLKRDEAGEPTHFLSFIEDVRQRMQSEQLPRALVRRMHEFQEQERQRVARELHDELGQMLTALKLELAWLQDQVGPQATSRASRMATMVDGVMASVRQLALGLRPAMLDDLGLEAALDWLLHETCGRHQLRWRLHKPRCPVELNGETRLTLFRICQEALTNILRHAEAREVVVKLSCSRSSVELTVQDDGIGLPEGRPANHGLLGIRDRAGLLGGSVKLTSVRPQGTRIMVRLPITPSVPATGPIPSWS